MARIKDVEIRFPRDRSALIEHAASLDEECVSVAGLAGELGMLRHSSQERPHVFGRLIEFARRAKGMSVEQLAKEADADLSEIVAIECEEDAMPRPRTVYQLAQVLELSARPLMALAGLTESRNRHVDDAALRFAARSEPTATLSENERAAFEEFVKVLAENSDGS